jgi:hypothetical protein
MRPQATGACGLKVLVLQAVIMMPAGSIALRVESMSVISFVLVKQVRCYKPSS